MDIPESFFLAFSQELGKVYGTQIGNFMNVHVVQSPSPS
jgi:hypothetical protein